MSDAAPFPIHAVENFAQWFPNCGRVRYVDGEWIKFKLHSIASFDNEFLRTRPAAETNDQLAVLRFLYEAKIGHHGSFWRGRDLEPTNETIEFRYANIKWGDLFDYYTVDGVLRIPTWRHMKHAIDEFLVEDPRTKFHPSRVQHFIEENGIDNLELME